VVTAEYEISQTLKSIVKENVKFVIIRISIPLYLTLSFKHDCCKQVQFVEIKILVNSFTLLVVNTYCIIEYDIKGSSCSRVICSSS